MEELWGSYGVTGELWGSYGGVTGELWVSYGGVVSLFFNQHCLFLILRLPAAGLYIYINDRK